MQFGVIQLVMEDRVKEESDISNCLMDVRWMEAILRGQIHTIVIVRIFCG